MVAAAGDRGGSARARRRRVKALRIALAIPGAFLAAALVMRTLGIHAPESVATDLAQPLAVVTNWSAYGAAQLGALMAALALAMWAYLRIVALGRGAVPGRPGSVLVVAGIAAFALLCAACVPVIFSSDVYAYAAYGELARLGADPYAHGLLPHGNALFDAAIVQWGNPPPACVYGPAFVAIAEAIVSLAAPFGAVVQLDGLRTLSSGALVLCVVLAYAAYPGSRADRLTAAATIGLNPVAIWGAAEGHNDALALAIALGGFALARRGLLGIGAAVVAFSGSVKLPGIAAAIPLVLANRRAAIGAVAGAAATLTISAPLFASVATRLAPHGRYAPQASFQAIVIPLARLLVPADGLASVVTWAIAAAAAAAFAAMAAAMLRRRQPEGWTYFALAGWLLVPNPYPWYALWLLAVAAVAPGSRGAAALLALSFASLLRYVPDAVGAPAPGVAIALGIAATLPFALLRPRASSGIINGS
ncbi:MAG: hypothetical protein ABI231_09030 [Candidatus Tumulicola sp.]